MNAFASAATTARPAAAVDTRHHFYGLEWLRFTMAIIMVAYHLAGNYAGNWSGFQYLSLMGFYATSVFFLLSGFLLTHVYGTREGGLDVRSFRIKRLAAIYPGHLFFMVIILCISLSKGALSPGDGGIDVLVAPHPVTGATLQEVPHDTISYAAAIAYFIRSIFLMQAWIPGYMWLNEPAWSVSALFFFYLMFPLGLAWFRRSQRLAAIMALLWVLYLIPPAIATYLGAVDSDTMGLLSRNPLLRLPEFLLGVGLYFVYRQLDPARLRRLRWPLVLLGASGAVLAAVLMRRDAHWYYLLHNGLLFGFQACLLLGCSAMAVPQSAAVRAAACRLGKASLAIYLSHATVMMVLLPLARIANTLASTTTGSVPTGLWAMAKAGTLPTWSFAAVLALAVVVGVILQELLFTPWQQKITQRFVPSRRVVPASSPASSGTTRQRQPA